MVDDTKFVGWSSVFQHVFVFTISIKCVPLIYIAEYTLEIKTFLCKNMFSLPVRNSKSYFGLRYTLLRHLY